MFCYIGNWIYLSYILGWSRDNATTEDRENDLFKMTIGENGHYKMPIIGIFDSTIQQQGNSVITLLCFCYKYIVFFLM